MTVPLLAPVLRRVCAFGLVLLLLSCANSSNTSDSTQEPVIKQGDPYQGSLEIGRQFIESGEYAKGVQYLFQMAKKYPKREEVHMYLGMGYFGLGNYEASSKSFSKVYELNSDNYDALLNLGMSQILLKRTLEARKTFDKIQKEGQYPYMERVHANYGLAWMEENRCDLAHRRFQVALQLDPTLVQAHFNMGLCYVRQQNYSSAVLSFKKAIDFCPGCLDPELEYAKALTLTGQRNLAVAKLETLLKTAQLDNRSITRIKATLAEISSMKASGATQK